MDKIKVNIIHSDHSVGRGVGFYADNLIKTLKANPEVQITNQDQDLDHYPFFDLFYSTLPIIKNKPTVVTIHDVTPLAMSTRYPKGIKGSLALLHQKLSLSNVNAIITDSTFSKKDIVNFLGIDSKKVYVTPLAVDPIYEKTYTTSKLKAIKEKYHLPDKFILNVSGGPNPNKNLPSLAEVTKQLDIPLVIVGKGMIQKVTEPVHPELSDLVALKKYNNLIYPGFVPTEDLVGIYQLATLYCQPSLYEGFGLPLLEAMSAGCLIVSSNSSSLPEIYHQDALNFDPKNTSQMKHVISKALSLSATEKEKQIKKAKEKSKEFAWEKTAKETIEIYKKIL